MSKPEIKAMASILKEHEWLETKALLTSMGQNLWKPKMGFSYLNIDIYCLFRGSEESSSPQFPIQKNTHLP